MKLSIMIHSVQCMNSVIQWQNSGIESWENLRCLTEIVQLSEVFLMCYIHNPEVKKWCEIFFILTFRIMHKHVNYLWTFFYVTKRYFRILFNIWNCFLTVYKLNFTMEKNIFFIISGWNKEPLFYKFKSWPIFRIAV